MNHHAHVRLLAWPLLMVVACVLLLAGCQDRSGPSLVTAPDDKSTVEGKKPEPPPPPLPADPAIIFQGDVEGEHGLYVMNADGSNVTRILTEGYFQGYSWSPGGDAIVLDGKLEPAPWGASHIWRVDIQVVDGVPIATNARILVDHVDPLGWSGLIRPAWSPVDPAWSTNGEQIVYARSSTVNPDQLRIEVVPAEGGDPVVLYTSESGRGLDQPTWSPDANRIAFQEGSRTGASRIRILDVASGQVTTVLDDDWSQQVGAEPTHLDWARTQDALVFHAGDDVYIMELPSGSPTWVVGAVSPSGRDRAVTPCWSPDDTEILFVRDWSKLQTIHLTTGEVTDITGRRDVGKFPDWRRF
jgi:Tol biopolymer transport system component